MRSAGIRPFTSEIGGPQRQLPAHYSSPFPGLHVLSRFNNCVAVFHL